MEGANVFETVMIRAWNIMSIEFTIYGFTFSYADVFLFSLLCGFGALAINVLLFRD